MTTYCQTNPSTSAAGQLLSDRSKYIPWASDWFAEQGDPSKAPQLPSAWANIANQGVFAPPNELEPGLFTDSATNLPLGNGFGSWAPNSSPVTPTQPDLLKMPTTSSAMWMIPNAPPFEAQTWPVCQTSTPTSLEGFTVMCDDGSIPTCANSQFTCASGTQTGWSTGVPLFVNNKYVPAFSKQPNQTSPFLNISVSGGETSGEYDLVDCGGIPCACVDNKDNVVPGAIPLATANSIMQEGIFETPTYGCTNNALLDRAVPISKAIYQNGQFVQEVAPTCPNLMVPACASSAGATVSMSQTPLYAVCQFETAVGTHEMPPMCSNNVAPTWDPTSSTFECNGQSVTCPPNAISQQPLLIMQTQCSDSSQPQCVTEPSCPSGSTPDVPLGFNLTTVEEGSSWANIGINPNNNEQFPNPVCDYFGVKQTDLCACNCIVDASGQPIAESLPEMIGNQISCPDPNTVMNCLEPANVPSCNDSSGARTGTVPMCEGPNGPVRAIFDASASGCSESNPSACVVCPSGLTGSPTCSNNLTISALNFVCLDPLPGTNQPSLLPVTCSSDIAGGACEPFTATQPQVVDANGTLACDRGTLFCPQEGTSNQPITNKTVCANNQPPVCIPSQGVCSSIYNMPEFGAQAIVPPNDNLMRSNYGVAFCSSEGGSNSCSTIFQSYFPMFDGPPGSNIQAVAPGSSSMPPTLLPDIMTAGGLAQGICLNADKMISNNPNGFQCALPSNPPTALTNWNEQGQGSTTVVEVSMPFQLFKDGNGNYPSEVFFQSQPGTQPYDSGQLYYIAQTQTIDSSGAHRPTTIGGHVAVEHGHKMQCPVEGETVRLVHPEADGPRRFEAQCMVSGVEPISAKESIEFPKRFADRGSACSEGKDLMCMELLDMPFLDEDGVFKCAKGNKPAVCLDAPESVWVPSRATKSKFKEELECKNGARLVDVDGKKVCEPLAALSASVPNQPCVNQVVNPANASITSMSQGDVSRLFSFDPVKGACVEKPVCSNGQCDTSFESESFIDYHEGETFFEFPGEPVIFQNDSSFPVKMFGDLGNPNSKQRLNPELVGIQPNPDSSATIQNSIYEVPSGFYYWPENTDSTKQGVTTRVAAEFIRNLWLPFYSKTATIDAVNSTFDSTGAGYDPSEYTLSSGKQTDVYESWFAPAVQGPLMSGAMAGQSSTFIQQNGIDSTKNAPIHSVPWQSENDEFTQYTTQDVMVQPFRYTEEMIVGKEFNKLDVGFNRCDQCGYFYCESTDGPLGNNCANVTDIPAIVLGNIPGDVNLNDSAVCNSMFGNVNYQFTSAFANSCIAPNPDNCYGRGVGCDANLQCKCNCDGQDFWFTRYTFTADGQDSCGTFCTPDQCKDKIGGVCSSASSVDAVCVNSDEIE